MAYTVSPGVSVQILQVKVISHAVAGGPSADNVNTRCEDIDDRSVVGEGSTSVVDIAGSDCGYSSGTSRASATSVSVGVSSSDLRESMISFEYMTT